mmetsp:Transcript_30374/g.38965  ORF Transcript_30374/g.38965 Transcript_30374/m.38965 type:complete len:108 (-) Transcript_30374:294-617(-)
MDQVLLGGRGQQKRLYAVDDKIYGTEEAVKLQQEAQDKAEKRKRKRKKKKSNTNETETSQEKLAKNDLEKNEQSSSNTSVKQSVAVVAVVGALAAGGSFLLGGKRSQ